MVVEIEGFAGVFDCSLSIDRPIINPENMSAAAKAKKAAAAAAAAANAMDQDVLETKEGDGTAPWVAHRLEELQKFNVNAADIDKLKQFGKIFSVEEVLMAPKKRILEVRGITEARYASLIQAAENVTQRSGGGFQNASDVDLSSKKLQFHVSTGSSELDALLGGGIESSSLTEVYGEFRTGKTQICMTVAVTAQINAKHPGKVIYVDTENSFRSERIRQICTRFDVDPETTLDNIVVARVFSVDQQEELLFHAEALICEGEGDVSLLIIDSIMALFRCDYSGRGELSERQQRLGKFLNMLKQISERHNIAVLYSNQVMSDPSGGLTFVADPKKPTGGHVLAHASNTRIMLRKGRDTERIAKLIDSPNRPEGDARFFISGVGIADSD